MSRRTKTFIDENYFEDWVGNQNTHNQNKKYNGNWNNKQVIVQQNQNVQNNYYRQNVNYYGNTYKILCKNSSLCKDYSFEHRNFHEHLQSKTKCPNGIKCKIFKMSDDESNIIRHNHSFIHVLE